MIKKQLEEEFSLFSPFVKNKLKPIIQVLLERAEDLDSIGKDDIKYYNEELNLIFKEVEKVNFIETEWKKLNL